MQREQIESESKVRMLELQAQQQQSALHSPQIDSMEVAVDTGYAANNNTVSYWDRIPKTLLFGSLFVFMGGLIWKAAK